MRERGLRERGLWERWRRTCDEEVRTLFRGGALPRAEGRSFRSTTPSRPVKGEPSVRALSRSNVRNVRPCTNGEKKKDGQVLRKKQTTRRFSPRGAPTPPPRPETACSRPRERSHPQTTPRGGENRVAFVAPCGRSAGSSKLSTELTSPARSDRKPKAYSVQSQSQNRST